MTPQQLMNLPYAGMAETQLRKQKDWRLDPSERLRLIMDKIYGSLDGAGDYIRDAEYELKKAYTSLEGNT